MDYFMVSLFPRLQSFESLSVVATENNWFMQRTLIMQKRFIKLVMKACEGSVGHFEYLFWVGVEKYNDALFDMRWYGHSNLFCCQEATPKVVKVCDTTTNNFTTFGAASWQQNKLYTGNNSRKTKNKKKTNDKKWPKLNKRQFY